MPESPAVRAPILTTVLPHERRTGGEIVTLAIAEALRRAGNSVPIVGYRRAGAASGPAEVVCAGTRPIETAGAGARVLPWVVGSLALGIPYSVAKYRSRRYLRAARGVLGERPALALLDHAQTHFAVRELERCGAPMVFVAHNVESDVYRRLARDASSRAHRWVYSREARLMAASESALTRRADQVWALTDDDAALLRLIDPGADVRTLTVASPMSPLDPRPPECDVALLGTWNWQANARGLNWFSQEVVSLLPSGTSVRVAGAGAEWLRGRHPGVSVLGRVADAREFLSRARVVAVPSTAGGGVQVKTLDAVATGLPVVATRAATRGLAQLPRSVTVVDSAREFAEALCRSISGNGSGGRTCRDAVEWSRARASRFDAEVGQWAAEAGGTARTG